MECDRKGPSGLWNGCSQMEETALRVLSAQLAPFEGPVRNCYEAGVQVPTLVGKRHEEEDILLAGFLLKRVLTDLRAVWLLTHVGYTSQAASVAAGLFEHALAVSCVAGSAACARELRTDKTGDLPWSAIQLSKMVAEQRRVEAIGRGEPFDQRRYEMAWREIYSLYKFLCKIKHPTLRSTVHDALSAAVKYGEYVVMAVPDLREEDLSLKATILTTSIRWCYDAIRRFAIALECDENSDYYKDFAGRMASVVQDVIEAYKATMRGPLPFDISDSSLSKEYAVLRARESPDS